MKAPLTTVSLLMRDQETLIATLQLPETFEPYEVVIWNGRYFVPSVRIHDTYHEAVSFCAINGD